MKVGRCKLVLLVLLLPLFVGCSAIRTVGMMGVGAANAPVPAQAQRESLWPWGFIIEVDPHVDTTIRVDKSLAETAAYYRDQLAQRGWRETKRDENDTRVAYEYSRESKFGAWGYAKESLSLLIDLATGDKANPAPVSVNIAIKGNYAWDAPSRFISNGLGRIFGRYSEGVMYLFLPL